MDEDPEALTEEFVSCLLKDACFDRIKKKYLPNTGSPLRNTLMERAAAKRETVSLEKRIVNARERWREHVREYQKRKYQGGPSLREYHNEYVREHREQINEYQRKYCKKRYREDSEYRERILAANRRSYWKKKGGGG